MASKISHIPAVVSSPALVAALLSFSIAQIAKVFTHYHATGKVDYGRIVGSGGMPSSHTALVVGLCTSIGLKEGMQSSIFALCLVFSLVVMYDATGVRLHAGRQAEVLNQLIVELCGLLGKVSFNTLTTCTCCPGRSRSFPSQTTRSPSDTSPVICIH